MEREDDEWQNKTWYDVAGFTDMINFNSFTYLQGDVEHIIKCVILYSAKSSTNVEVISFLIVCKVLTLDKIASLASMETE